MEYFDKIEDYLAGQLSPEEREQFKKEISQNAELADAVKAHELAREAMEVAIEESLRKELGQLQQEFYPSQKGSASPPPKNTSSKGKIVPMRSAWVRVAVAASILMLIGIFVFRWTGNHYSSEAIAADFAREMTPQNTIRGGNQQNELSPILDQIDEGRYSEAIEGIKAIPSGSDFYEKARYALGYALFKQGKYEQALRELEPLVSGSDANLRDSAEWFSLLIMLEQGKEDNPEFKERLNKILLNPNHSHNPDAKKMDSKIKGLPHQIAR